MLEREETVFYNKSFYIGSSLKFFARLYLKKLPPEVTHLVCRGRSGVAIASAMITLARRPLVFYPVAKSFEAHGTYSSTCPDSRHVVCFVDDFISYGNTVKDVFAEVKFKYALVCHRDCFNVGELPDVKFIFLGKGGCDV